MQSDHEKEVYDFLAGKMLSAADRKKQKEVLLFWTDLVAGDFERNIATAGLDSEDKAYIRKTTENWFYSTLLEILFEMGESDQDPAACRIRLKKAVLARVRNIIKDLLFERKSGERQEASGGKTEKKEDEKDVAESFHPERTNRSGLRISHLNPGVQDTVFMDPFSDAETQYLCREILSENNAGHKGGIRAFLGKQGGGVPAKLSDEDVGVFLAKQAHLETLRAQLANKRHSDASEV
ncbi:MAG: hypothetical protein K9K62_10320 [Desulfobacteraceae bacterium]|nr:hypothetical protein [Desulfobacteraceae bacterium]